MTMKMCKCCGNNVEPYGFYSVWDGKPWTGKKIEARRKELEKVYEIVDVGAHHEGGSNIVCVVCYEGGCKCGGRDLIDVPGISSKISSGDYSGPGGCFLPRDNDAKLEEILQRIKALEKEVKQLIYISPHNEIESITDLPLPDNADPPLPENGDPEQSENR